MRLHDGLGQLAWDQSSGRHSGRQSGRQRRPRQNHLVTRSNSWKPTRTPNRQAVWGKKDVALFCWWDVTWKTEALGPVICWIFGTNEIPPLVYGPKTLSDGSLTRFIFRSMWLINDFVRRWGSPIFGNSADIHYSYQNCHLKDFSHFRTKPCSTVVSSRLDIKYPRKIFSSILQFPFNCDG